MPDINPCTATLAGFIVLALGLLYRQHMRDKQRTAQLARVALELGLNFKPAADSILLAGMRHYELPLFRRDQLRLSDALRGTFEGREVLVFDLVGYILTQKFNSTHYSETESDWAAVVCVQLKRCNLPVFRLFPEEFHHKVAALMGYQDIDFTTHPEFSRKFQLQGRDEAAIRQVFVPELLKLYETKSTIHTEAAGDRVIFYRRGRRIKPEEVRKRLEEASQFVALLELYTEPSSSD